MKPSGIVMELAGAIESAWREDMKVAYGGHEALTLDERLERRVEALRTARKARLGVVERAAELGALLVQIHHVGDDEAAAQPELPLVAPSDTREEDGGDVLLPKKRGSPRTRSQPLAVVLDEDDGDIGEDEDDE